MNKGELVNAISEKTGVTKKASEEALNAILDSIKDALVNGEKIQLVGFGSFETKVRAARKGKNPQTGAELKIPACKAPIFKAGKALKDVVNK